jgi:hypothetical protein
VPHRRRALDVDFFNASYVLRVEARPAGAWEHSRVSGRVLDRLGAAFREDAVELALTTAVARLSGIRVGVRLDRLASARLAGTYSLGLSF